MTPLAVRLFRVLLLAYPPALRREHGAEMTLVFSERWRERRTPGGRLRLIADLLVDFAVSLPRTWRASFGHRSAKPTRLFGFGQTSTDLRTAIRLFTRAPLFAAGAVITLALGIGAATAVFSLADAALLRPLPIPSPARVVQMGWSWSYPDFQNLAAEQDVFSALASWTNINIGVEHDGSTDRLDAAGVSGGYFALADQRPVAGRLLDEHDNQRGAPAVAVLNERVWRSLFHADPSVVGGSITINRRPVAVVGIVPARFRGFSLRNAPGVYVPIAALPEISTGFLSRPGLLANRDTTWLSIAGRLKDGVTMEAAERRSDTIYRRLHPPKDPSAPVEGTELAPLVANAIGLKTAGDLRQFVFVLVGATALTLLLSCATVANLMLVRAERRRRELALRAALGAGRWRLGRLLLIESLAIGIAGSLGGLLVARAGMVMLRVFALPGRIPIADLDLALNLRLLTAAIGLGLFTALLFGLAPIWRATRLDISNTLRDGGRGSSRQPLRTTLVAAQVTLCVLLLGGGLAFGRALRFALAVDWGFDTAHTAIITTDPTLVRFTRDEQIEFQRRAREALSAQSWVAGAAWAAMRPLDGSMSFQVAVPGYVPPNRDTSVQTNVISGGFFGAMGIPILTGRAIGETDTFNTPTVAVLSQAAARRFWPSGNALESRFSLGELDSKDPHAWATVIGIAADTKRGVGGSGEPMLYLASSQQPDMLDFGGQHLVVRSTALSPETALRETEALLRRVAPQVPQTRSQTMHEQLDGLLVSQRMGLTLFVLFAGLAVVLAVFGIYATVAYAVATRTREIGIRVALGAARIGVLRIVVAQGLAPVGFGLAAGLTGFLGASAALSRFMFALPVGTPLSLAAITAGVLVVAAVALLLPSKRALDVDPAVALRGD